MDTLSGEKVELIVSTLAAHTPITRL